MRPEPLNQLYLICSHIPLLCLGLGYQSLILRDQSQSVTLKGLLTNTGGMQRECREVEAWGVT